MLTKIHNTIYAIERFFLVLAILCLSLLLAFQLLHGWDGDILPDFYQSLLHHKSYGTKPIFSAGKITLSTYEKESNNSSLSVVVNGETYGKFVHNQIDLIVRNHDIISIEGAEPNTSSLKFEVTSTTKNIVHPQINKIFTLNDDDDQLFKVELH